MTLYISDIDTTSRIAHWYACSKHAEQTLFNMGRDFWCIQLFFICMCCNIQRPQLHYATTWQYPAQRQKVPVGPAVGSWMDAVLLSTHLYHIYSSHQGWAEPGWGLGGVDMGKHFSHSTCSKGKGNFVTKQHMSNQKSHSRIQKWWQDFVFVEMERREEGGLEKHNSVADAPTLLQFLTVFHSDVMNYWLLLGM